MRRLQSSWSHYRPKPWKRPRPSLFRWGAAVLALVTPFLTDLCEEFYPGPDERFLKLAFKAAAVATFLMATVLWSDDESHGIKKKRPEMIFRRALAILMYLFAPGLILARSLQMHAGSLVEIPPSTWAALGSLVVVFVSAVLMQYFLR